MKRIQILFLQVAVVVIGIGAFALMILEPLREGRNVGATLYQVYFNDLFLAYAYTASISFYVGLYKVFRLLGYIGRGEIFSEAAIKTVRTIKYCGVILASFIGAAVGYLFIVRPGDDIAGGVFIGLLVSFISLVVAASAAVFERILKRE